jgi:hypothetical protein
MGTNKGRPRGDAVAVIVNIKSGKFSTITVREQLLTTNREIVYVKS